MDDVVKGKVEAEEPEPAQESERRSFFKKAFLTAAGMAFVASAEGAEAQAAEGPRLHAGEVNVVFTEGKVALFDLRSAVKQIITTAGCSGCGLVGFDINFLRGAVINPADLGLPGPGVQSILVTSE